MKPHEDELQLSTNGQNPALVAKSDGRMVAQLRQQDVKEWQALLLAATKLARAMLANGYVRTGVGGDGRWHLDMCNELNTGSDCHQPCELAREALTEAGVLP